MSWYDPLGPNQSVPATLQWLSEHPERGRWQSAALLQRAMARWPKWPLQLVLVTVDSDLRAHLVDFLVRPPFGWREEDRDLPQPLTPERVVHEGLSPHQAVSLLNQTLGSMRVVHNQPFGQRAENRLGEGAGMTPTWSSVVLGWNGSCIRIELGEHAYAQFDAVLRNSGSLLNQAEAWANGFVTALSACRLFKAAVKQQELRSGFP